MIWTDGAKELRHEDDREMSAQTMEFARQYIGEGLFLDIGACVGMFCIPMLLEFGKARCVAFEPNPDAYSVLLDMAEANGVSDRLEVHPVALFDEDGEGTLRVPDPKNKIGLSTLGRADRIKDGGMDFHTFLVKKRTLDSFGLEGIEFIKMDTEGAEIHVLRGGEATIKREMPPLVLELQVKNTNLFGYNTSSVRGLLEGWGYKCRKGTARDLFCESG